MNEQEWFVKQNLSKTGLCDHTLFLPDSSCMGVKTDSHNRLRGCRRFMGSSRWDLQEMNLMREEDGVMKFVWCFGLSQHLHSRKGSHVIHPYWTVLNGLQIVMRLHLVRSFHKIFHSRIHELLDSR
jgi:hypothetical protein